MEEDMSINGKLCKKVFIGRGYSTRAYLQVHNQQTEAVWHNGNGGLHAYIHVHMKGECYIHMLEKIFSLQQKG